jgi:hypothetical protein
MSQTAVAVAPVPPAGFSPYGTYDYSPARLPYPPVMGTSPSQRRGRLPRMFVTLGVVFAVLLVGAAAIGIQDRNHTRNALNNTTIEFPATAAGLSKITGAQADRLSAIAAGQTDCTCGITYQIVGYSQADGSPKAVVVAGKVPVGSDLDAAIAGEERGFNDSAAAKSETSTVFTDVDAGSLGGKMQCNRVFSTIPTTVCMFVDRAVVGSVAIYDLQGSDASNDLALVHQMRAAVEIRT